MEHLPTIIVAVIIAAVFVAIIAKAVIDKKKGKSSCSCGCQGCTLNCHGNEKK